MFRRCKTLTIALFLGGTASIAACGDSTGPETGRATILLAGDGSVAASAIPAGLRLSLGDVPVAAVGSIDLTVTRVDLHRIGDGGEGAEGGAGGEGGEGGEGDGGGWFALDLAAESAVDLMALPTTGGVEVASGSLPAGLYNQVRLYFSTSMLTLAQTVNVGGQDRAPGTYDIRIPSADQSGYKIQTGQFEIGGGETASVMIEVATSASIGSLVWNANGFQLSPVMRAR